MDLSNLEYFVILQSELDLKLLEVRYPEGLKKVKFTMKTSRSREIRFASLPKGLHEFQSDVLTGDLLFQKKYAPPPIALRRECDPLISNVYGLGRSIDLHSACVKSLGRHVTVLVSSLLPVMIAKLG